MDRNDFDNEEFKEAVREAIDSWLTKQFAAFGRWTLYGLLSALLAAAVSFTIWVSLNIKLH